MRLFGKEIVVLFPFDFHFAFLLFCKIVTFAPFDGGFPSHSITSGSFSFSGNAYIAYILYLLLSVVNQTFPILIKVCYSCVVNSLTVYFEPFTHFLQYFSSLLFNNSFSSGPTPKSKHPPFTVISMSVFITI